MNEKGAIIIIFMSGHCLSLLFFEWIPLIYRSPVPKDGDFNKLAEKFKNWNTYNPFNSFEDYYILKAQDGPMCRNNTDCKWIDEKMRCDKNSFDEKPNKLWFSGDIGSIKGKCDCPKYYVWDKFECKNFFDIILIQLGGMTVLYFIVYICLCLKDKCQEKARNEDDQNQTYEEKLPAIAAARV